MRLRSAGEGKTISNTQSRGCLCEGHDVSNLLAGALFHQAKILIIVATAAAGVILVVVIRVIAMSAIMIAAAATATTAATTATIIVVATTAGARSKVRWKFNLNGYRDDNDIHNRGRG